MTAILPGLSGRSKVASRRRPRIALIPAVSEFAQRTSEHQRYLRRVANTHHPTPIIINNDEESSAATIQVIFELARDSVKILTDDLCPQVYERDKVIAAATNLLRRHRNSKIEVWSRKPLVGNHGFLQAIALHGLDNRFWFRTLNGKLGQAYQFNFVVADAQHYRFQEFEFARTAVVQFWEPKFSGKLDRLFDTITSAQSLVTAFELRLEAVTKRGAVGSG